MILNINKLEYREREMLTNRLNRVLDGTRLIYGFNGVKHYESSFIYSDLELHSWDKYLIIRDDRVVKYSRSSRDVKMALDGKNLIELVTEWRRLYQEQKIKKGELQWIKCKH